MQVALRASLHAIGQAALHHGERQVHSVTNGAVRVSDVVVGAGAAGISAAAELSQISGKVVLINGGLQQNGMAAAGCLFRDPKILNTARPKTVHEANNDQDGTRAFGQTLSKVAGTLTKKLRERGIIVCDGRASFVSPHAVSSTSSSGICTRFYADRFFVATGATGPVTCGENVLQASDLIGGTQMPQELTVILGTGAQEIEVAQLAARNGSKVTVIDPNNEGMQAVDSNAKRMLFDLLSNEGNTKILFSPVASISDNPHGVEVHLEDGTNLNTGAIVLGEEGPPNIEGLNLKNIFPKYSRVEAYQSEAGFGKVAPHVYTIGAVSGPQNSIFPKPIQARLAVHSLFPKPPFLFDVLETNVVFSKPDVVGLGATKQVLDRIGIGHTTEIEGQIVKYRDPRTGKPLGLHSVGCHDLERIWS